MGRSFDKNKLSTPYVPGPCHLAATREQARPRLIPEHPDLLGGTDEKGASRGSPGCERCRGSAGAGTPREPVSRPRNLYRRGCSSSQENSHPREVGARHHKPDPLTKPSLSERRSDLGNGFVSDAGLLTGRGPATQPLILLCG